MTNRQKSFSIASMLAVLVLGGVVGGNAMRLPTGKSSYLCDHIDCPVCDPEGIDPTLPACPTDSGWLCCNDELTICGPGLGNGSCPGIDMWCDYYETSPDGFSECWDEWGQG